MSKTSTAPATTQVQETEKKAKKPLFGLSQEELKMVVGGTGVIVTKQNPGR